MYANLTKEIKVNTSHLALELVRYSDEISNRKFIVDFVKVVDFIEENG